MVDDYAGVVFLPPLLAQRVIEPRVVCGNKMTPLQNSVSSGRPLRAQGTGKGATTCRRNGAAARDFHQLAPRQPEVFPLLHATHTLLRDSRSTRMAMIVYDRSMTCNFSAGRKPELNLSAKCPVHIRPSLSC